MKKNHPSPPRYLTFCLFCFVLYLIFLFLLLASWHPGNRIHQVTGRVIAFTILQALKEVLTMWNDADGYDVPDESWHVTKYYNDKRKKVIAMADIGPCKEYKELDLDFACKYAMKVQ